MVSDTVMGQTKNRKILNYPKFQNQLSKNRTSEIQSFDLTRLHTLIQNHTGWGVSNATPKIANNFQINGFSENLLMYDF